MEDLMDKIAERQIKKTARLVMKKVSKIVYKALREVFKEGWIESDKVDLTPDFCEHECKMWDTEYRCRDCEK